MSLHRVGNLLFRALWMHASYFIHFCVFSQSLNLRSTGQNVGQPEATIHSAAGQKEVFLTFNFAKSTRAAGSLEAPLTIGCEIFWEISGQDVGKKKRVERTTVICQIQFRSLPHVPDPPYNIHYFPISYPHTYAAQQPAALVCSCPCHNLTATTSS